MQSIDEQNAVAYLRQQRFVDAGEELRTRELHGGVSNVVLLVSRSGGDDFVLKQAREQLRVAEPWFCSVERIWREVEVMRICERLLADRDNTESIPATTPRVLFTDSENYLFAMTAIPSHTTWKDELLRGSVDGDKATACGWLLGQLHSGTWRGDGLPASLSDRQFFEELRIDPYYRHVARVHPELRIEMDELIESVYDHRQALVHGDFSPKNLLVYDRGIALVDFEVGHFGDPAFDLGFFLTHLFLKSFHSGPDYARYLPLVGLFWAAYLLPLKAVATRKELESLNRRAVANLAGCMLARVDGKSKVEYLDDANRDRVRRFARKLLCDPEDDLLAVVKRVRNRLHE